MISSITFMNLIRFIQLQYYTVYATGSGIGAFAPSPPLMPQLFFLSFPQLFSQKNDKEDKIDIYSICLLAT